MPSIAEIIAARIAAKQAAAAPDTTPRESMTEKLELDALDARLAPVKPTVAAAARKATGIVLSRDLPPSSPNGEARGQATPIKGPEDRRSLGETEGEGIDMTPMAADECIKDWHKAVNAFSTDLCIMRDPIDPERAWLAVRLEDEPLHPLLLRDLPLYEHPRTPRPTNQPF